MYVNKRIEGDYDMKVEQPTLIELEKKRRGYAMKSLYYKWFNVNDEDLIRIYGYLAKSFENLIRKRREEGK